MMGSSDQCLLIKRQIKIPEDRLRPVENLPLRHVGTLAQFVHRTEAPPLMN